MVSRNLELTLQYAKDLNKVNLFTKMDVYAIVSISGGDKKSKQQVKTPVDRDGDANPTWNFPMKFTVDEAALLNNRLTLDFKLMCQRALGDKDVGEVHVPLKELLDSPAKGGAADGKRFVSYQVRKPSGKPKGQITFSYKICDQSSGATSAPPYAAAKPTGEVYGEPVVAYPAGPSSVYPPPPQTSSVYPPPPHTGVYPPPPAYPVVGSEADGRHYPPPAGYPTAPSVGGYPSHGYGYPQPGYGYPPPPPPGYGYPAAAPMQQPPKKNKFGMGLGAGLLGGALGGLLIGDMISDVGDYDCGGGFDF